MHEKAAGSNVTIYYDVNGDNVYDGYKNISIGPRPDGFDPDRDAIDHALLVLLNKLNFIADLNSGTGNGSVADPYDGINESNPIDVPIGENIRFESNYISDIQSLWGPAIMEIRVWLNP